MNGSSLRALCAGCFATLVLSLAADAVRAQTPPSPPRSATIVSINDVYTVQGLQRGHVGGLARVRSLIDEVQAASGRAPLVLHAGDALFPSLLSGPAHDDDVTDGGKHMIQVLNMLVPSPNPDAALPSTSMLFTIGNHELDRAECHDADDLVARMAESSFVWLGGNIEFDFANCGTALTPEAALRLQPSVLVDAGDLRIGVLGLTTDVKEAAYVRGFASPRDTAKRLTADLRARGADVVIALTHLDADEDLRILENLGADGPDLIVGGHEHENMANYVLAGSNDDDPRAPRTDGRRQRAVFKANAEARSANVIGISIDDEGIKIDRELRTLTGKRPRENEDVKKAIENIVKDHQRRFCAKHEPSKDPDTCLDEDIGRAGTDVVGDESVVRGRESSLGNWLADLAAEHCGTDVALLNAGSVRLNETIFAGDGIRRRDLENMLLYPTDLVRFTIDSATLQQVLHRAITDWPGSGHWLLTSGIAFVHQPTSAGIVVPPSRVTLIGQRRLVRNDDRITIATSKFLANGGDGYAMLPQGALGPIEACTGRSLKEIALQELKDTKFKGGITPVVEGRICQGATRCLAAADSAPCSTGPSGVAWLALLVVAAMIVVVLAS